MKTRIKGLRSASDGVSSVHRMDTQRSFMVWRPGKAAASALPVSLTCVSRHFLFIINVPSQVCVIRQEATRVRNLYFKKVKSDRSYMCGGGGDSTRQGACGCRGTTVGLICANSCIIKAPWKSATNIHHCEVLELKRSSFLLSVTPAGHRHIHHREFHELQRSSFLLVQSDKACGLQRIWV